MNENFFDSIAKVCDSAVETPKAQPKRQPAAPIRRRAPRVADAARSYRVKVSVRHARDFYDALVDGRFKFTQEASDVFVVRADKDEIRDIAAQVGIPQDEYEVEKGIRDAAGADDFKVGDKVSITGPEAHRRSEKLYGKEGVVKEYAPVNNLIVVDIDGKEEALHPSVCKKISDDADGGRSYDELSEEKYRLRKLYNLVKLEFFNTLASAKEYAEGQFPTLAVMHGDNGLYWVVDRPSAKRLVEKGYEYAIPVSDSSVRYKLGDSTLLSQEQLEANTPAWVADKEKWTEAVARATDGGKKQVEGTLVAAVYKKLGGTIAGKTTDDADGGEKLKQEYKESLQAEDEARKAYDRLKNIPMSDWNASTTNEFNKALDRYKEAMANTTRIRREWNKAAGAVSDAANSEDWVLVYDGDKSKYLIRNYFKYESPFTTDLTRAIHFATENEAKDYARQRGLFFIPQKNEPTGVKDSADTDFIFSPESDNVTDNKGHFPIPDVAHGRNALAQVAKYDKLPEWYDGKMTLEEFKKFVRDAVAKAFPSIEVTDDGNSDAEDTLRKIREWAEGSVSYLSERSDYSRGYKAGIVQAQEIVLDLLEGKKE